MKRSPLKRSTPLRRLSALKSRGQTSKERKWRKSVLEHCGYRCQFPGCVFGSGPLEAHHVNSRQQRPDLKNDVSNGIALCAEHHRFVTDNPDEGTKLGLVRHDRYEAREQRAAGEREE